jgi:hypothetical protein
VSPSGKGCYRKPRNLRKLISGALATLSGLKLGSSDQAVKDGRSVSESNGCPH